MWADPKWSKRTIATRLGISPNLVNDYAARLGLSPRPKVRDWRIAEALGETYNDALDDSLERDRQAWLSAREAYPEASRSHLRRRFHPLYERLKKRDPDWLEEHFPACIPSTPFVYGGPKERDTRLAVAVREVAQRIQARSGRPKRVTTTAINGELVAPVPTADMKSLPLAASALAEVIETHEQFAARRIEWALQEFQAQRVCPCRSSFVIRAGICAYQYEPHIAKRIDQALAGLATTDSN